nr:hypothetical protein [Tanacetum cinerariifolium]
MAAPTIPVSAEENLEDLIDITVDIIHLEPVVVVAFPAAAVKRTLAQYGEAIRGIQENLLGVPIQEELTALRFRVDITKADNASLIKTMEAVEKVMVAPTISVFAEENLKDPIEIRVDVVHPVPVAAVDFLASTIVRTLAQHEEAIWGMQDHLLRVPIQEELMALRFKVDTIESENASLHATTRTTEAIKMVTRNHER